MRPVTIKWFEWSMLFSVVLALAVEAASIMAILEALGPAPSAPINPQDPASIAEGMAHTLVYGSIGTAAVVLLLFLGLVFWISRGGSVIAKWIFAILVGLSVLASVLGLPSLVLEEDITNMAQLGSLAYLLVQIALQVFAIHLLFLPESRPWFDAYQRIHRTGA